MFRPTVVIWLPAIAAALLGGCSVTPNPFSASELAVMAEANLTRVTANQEPLTKPVDLHEAMARALKYNLDYRVEAVQTSLRMAELNLAHYALLPDVVANAGFAARNNTLASSSLNLLTDTPNFGASTSQDKHLMSGDLAFSWNILDFGLSYVRAQQSADRVLINEEAQRKIAHHLLEDVRSAYWRAASYDVLVKRLKHLRERTKTALANNRALAESLQTSTVSALTDERELVEINSAITHLQRNIVAAKAELAALMNVKPGTPFEIVVKSRPRAPARLPLQLDQMMLSAVQGRAELRENWYQQRINMHEARAALLALLPGLKLYSGPNWDSNSYLLNSDWVAWGAKASWNLLNVFQYPAKRRAIELRDDVLKAQALALTMAVMTQLHVSRIRFHHFQHELAAADEYRSVQNRLIQQMRREAEAKRISEQVLLREEMNALVAEAKYDIAYAGLQSAHANVLASIGWDPYGNIGLSLPVDEIAGQLRRGSLQHGSLKTTVGPMYR